MVPTQQTKQTIALRFAVRISYLERRKEVRSLWPRPRAGVPPLQRTPAR